MKLIKKRSSKSKSAKFILFVGDEGAILVHLQGEKVAKRLFAPNPEPASVKMFTELFATAPKIPLYLLVDTIDQSYVRHDLPPVSAMSINKLIKRRLERDFAVEDIKGAISLGREKQGRKDWNYLLISLANTAWLSQWLTLALEAPNPFKGIYLVPVEAQQFVARLSQIMKMEKGRDKSSWQILVSHNKVGGFRQVVFRDGRLVFTRLAQPIGETMAEVIAGNIEQEVLNTIEYIKRLSYQEQAGLDLFIIVSQEIKNAIDAGKFKATNVEIYTPFEGAAKFEIEQAALPGDHFGDVLLAASFGSSRKQSLRLTTPYIQKLDMLRKANGGIKTLTALTACSLLYVSGSAVYDVISVSGERERTEAAQRAAGANLEKIREQAKTLPMDVELVAKTLDIYHFLSKDDYNPLSFIASLSKLVSEDTSVRSLVWKVPKPGEILAPATPLVDPTAPIVTGPTVAELDVEFTRNTANAEEFLRYSGDFFTSLRETFKDYQVTVAQLPGTVADTETVKLSFEETIKLNNNAFEAGKPVIVKVTIAGPTTAPAGTPPPAPITPASAGI